jgi:hypothetical protein
MNHGIEEGSQLPQIAIYHFFLRDANGYLVEVQRFKVPRSPR